jgi:hypothetical protein
MIGVNEVNKTNHAEKRITNIRGKSIVLIVLLSVLLAAAALFSGCQRKGGSGTGNFSSDSQNATFLSDTKPIFSDLGGFFTGTMKLSISLPKYYESSNFDIRMTFNGTEPAGGSDKYSGQPITIPNEYSTVTDFDDPKQNVSVTVVRAACFTQDRQMVGQIATATFIQVKDPSRFTMPVIALATASNNLDGAAGIFTNSSGRGSAWERPVFVQYFDNNGTLCISQDAGLRLFGGSSRGLSQRSFRLTARVSDYFNTSVYDGDTKFRYKLFEGRLKGNGKELKSYDSFVLRNGGNDSLLTPTEPFRATFMRDGIASMIAQKAAPEILNMNYKPVIVFLNGEYYGIMNMREHQNDNMVRNVYDIDDKENISVISSELDTSRGGRYDGRWFYYVLDDGADGELEIYENLLDSILAGKLTYAQAAARIDMDNFMKFCAVNLFLCNTDWPHNNIKVWRYSGPVSDGVKDGKWRFMFKDQDLGLSRYTVGTLPGYPIELYTRADSKNFRLMLIGYIDYDKNGGYPDVSETFYPDSTRLQGLFAFCLQDAGFRKAFADYSKELATVIWPADELEQLITDSYNRLLPELRNYMNKQYFGGWKFSITTNLDAWKEATLTGDDSLLAWAKARTGANGEFMKQVNELMAKF